ncbi:hypothetical protein B0H67DRAFT_380409 [Lasiosphaeris hirsuta]|uniref:Uncharacterized protein n=1 Tax=Lasiosphaeris hirsuta TaxID=260670 RepID=A0AA39ZXD4_9PEZI|nr:hypothetical protein B0H67DRAFT_380409 [Lasiosphaeris hirsuta]
MAIHTNASQNTSPAAQTVARRAPTVMWKPQCPINPAQDDGLSRTQRPQRPRVRSCSSWCSRRAVVGQHPYPSVSGIGALVFVMSFVGERNILWRVARLALLHWLLGGTFSIETPSLQRKGVGEAREVGQHSTPQQHGLPYACKGGISLASSPGFRCKRGRAARLEGGEDERGDGQQKFAGVLEAFETTSESRKPSLQSRRARECGDF